MNGTGLFGAFSLLSATAATTLISLQLLLRGREGIGVESALWRLLRLL